MLSPKNPLPEGNAKVHGCLPNHEAALAAAPAQGGEDGHTDRRSGRTNRDSGDRNHTNLENAGPDSEGTASSSVAAEPWSDGHAVSGVVPTESVAAQGAPAQQEIVEVNLADYARKYFESFDMYLHAWLREIGGVIVPKHHQIDGFVLRTQGIYEKAKLVDRIKKILVDQLKAKANAEQMFDAVFKFLAEDGHDKIPTN